MEHNIQTIEDLARLIKNTMASKEDIQVVKGDIQELRAEMKQEFAVVHSRLDHLDARVGRVEADIHELRDEVVHRREFDDALARIKYLEKK
jgi:chromosome condensin MukBEF ATPase and DNA-binding subunit MukB